MSLVQGLEEERCHTLSRFSRRSSPFSALVKVTNWTIFYDLSVRSFIWFESWSWESENGCCFSSKGKLQSRSLQPWLCYAMLIYSHYCLGFVACAVLVLLLSFPNHICLTVPIPSEWNRPSTPKETQKPCSRFTLTFQFLPKRMVPPFHSDLVLSNLIIV